jgi:hypothetical protein
MKRGVVFLSVAAALVCAFALGRARAQDDGGDPMEAWAALGKTGPEHAALMKDVGTWNCACKGWEKPGSEPKESTGKAVFSSVLDGRYLKQEFEGTDMNGQPMHGIGYMGYNNATKQYESIWMDSGSTGIGFMTGTETEPGKVWTYTGNFDGPGGTKMKMKLVLTKKNADTQLMEMYMDMGMGDMKGMEMTYTRAK